jgi:hypothetical protein
MPDAAQADASAGLFCLAVFLALAVAGALYVEHRLARIEKKKLEGVK